MADYKLIMRYLKVKALADRGSRGERDNAKRILSRLETDNPGLKGKAESFVSAMEGEKSEDSSYREKPHNEWGKQPQSQPSSFWATGNWENIFRYAQTAAGAAYGFAEAFSQAHEERHPIEIDAIKLTTKLSNRGDGSVVVAFKIPLSVYRELLTLDPVRKALIVERMKSELHSELNRLFGDG